ncbi:MAG: murein transglycosylase A [Parvibaculaceae bacterium]
MAALQCGLAVVLLAMSVTSDAAAGSNLTRVSFASLPGWKDDAHGEALATFRRSCREILDRGAAFGRSITYGGHREDWTDACVAANDVKPSAARAFFEKRFVPVAVSDPERAAGLFTGYYEPEVEGSLKRGGRFTVPIYAKPKDLVALDAAGRKATGLSYGRVANGKARPYYTRKEIEEGQLAGRGLEIVWLSDWADAFFIQVQGSGRVRLAEGGMLRLNFAAKTGLPYTAIGGILVERGEIAREDVSMQSIRAWMTMRPQEARELMWKNESYVFFQKAPSDDPSLGPPGAQRVALTPGRSLAVDRGFWAFGTPMWIDTTHPSSGGEKGFRHLMVAQDTGTAIKGRVRGDVFWGTGDEAAFIAGHMKAPGRMVALLPGPVAKRLGLGNP